MTDPTTQKLVVHGAARMQRHNRAPYLMPGDQVLGEGPVVGEDVDDLSIGKLVAGHHILAVHLGSYHVVAHICVHMVCKVQYGGALQTHAQTDM